jgi:hypothetical protein
LLADLRVGPFANAVALLEHGYVIHRFPFPVAMTEGFGLEPVEFRLGQEHPVSRWEHFAGEALDAASAGCEVLVGMDNVGDIHLRFASDETWQ